MAQPNTGQGSQPLIKPDQVDNLPFLTPELKSQYKAGLTTLWSQLEAQPQGSPQHQEALNKLRNVCSKLMQHLANTSKNNRPASQGRPAQPTVAQPGAAGNVQPPQNPQAGQPQQAAGGGSGGGGAMNLPPAVRAELTAYKVNVPPHVAQQGPEQAALYRKKFIQHLAGLHQRKELARSRGQQMMQQANRYTTAGQAAPPELTQTMNEARREMNQADTEIRNMKAKNDSHATKGADMQRQGSLTGKSQAAAPSQPNGAQQPQQQQAPNIGQSGNNVAIKQQQTDVKPNMEQQRPTQSPAQPQGTPQQQHPPNVQRVAPSGTPQQGVAQATTTALPNQPTPQSATQTRPPQNFPQQPNMSHQQQTPQRPQINTQQMAQQQQGPHQGTPTNAGSQGPGPQHLPPQQQQQQQQRPQPLTHQAAMNQAAESYSRQQSQTQVPQQQQMPQMPNGMPMTNPPNSAGASQTPPSQFPPMGQSGQNPSATTKFPIPKTLSLDPRTQMPAQGPPSRPTLGNTGMMQQPGTQRAPAFTLEGEGDRVLSKRKLDELVRQVTGGGEDGALGPDVEEAVLTLADDFVDNVITAACRLAKLRASQTLDIRDLQMVLERNYGIRVPGYAVDEVRTVRKFQPAPGWQSKMQAIQAGKVMGNKES